MKNNIIRKIVFKIRDLFLPKHIGKESYLYIQNKIQSDSPLMVARFGAVEIKAVLYAILGPLGRLRYFLGGNCASQSTNVLEQ